MKSRAILIIDQDGRLSGDRSAFEAMKDQRPITEATFQIIRAMVRVRMANNARLNTGCSPYPNAR